MVVVVVATCSTTHFVACVCPLAISVRVRLALALSQVVRSRRSASLRWTVSCQLARELAGAASHLSHHRRALSEVQHAPPSSAPPPTTPVGSRSSSTPCPYEASCSSPSSQRSSPLGAEAFSSPQPARLAPKHQAGTTPLSTPSRPNPPSPLASPSPLSTPTRVCSEPVVDASASATATTTATAFATAACRLSPPCASSTRPLDPQGHVRVMSPIQSSQVKSSVQLMRTYQQLDQRAVSTHRQGNSPLLASLITYHFHLYHTPLSITHHLPLRVSAPRRCNSPLLASLIITYHLPLKVSALRRGNSPLLASRYASIGTFSPPTHQMPCHVPPAHTPPRPAPNGHSITHAHGTHAHARTHSTNSTNAYESPTPAAKGALGGGTGGSPLAHDHAHRMGPRHRSAPRLGGFASTLATPHPHPSCSRSPNPRLRGGASAPVSRDGHCSAAGGVVVQLQGAGTVMAIDPLVPSSMAVTQFSPSPVVHERRGDRARIGYSANGSALPHARPITTGAIPFASPSFPQRKPAPFAYERCDKFARSGAWGAGKCSRSFLSTAYL